MLETFRKIMRQVRRDGACLRWTGHKNKSGYGWVWSSETRKAAFTHRIVYEAFHGPIPPGLSIDHVKANGCRHRDCVRIDHLEAVTLAENTARSGAAAGLRRWRLLNAPDLFRPDA